MRIRSLFLAVMMLAFSRTVAQDYDHYRPLQCQGPIPEELRISSSQKYAEAVAQLGDSLQGREGRSRDNFLLQSNFVLDEMLLSGRVLFGDPVTEYVTRVKDYLLRAQPDLQKKVRIYLVKSPVVNAFATNSGVLLINMGLIAHLKSEAELAFVLCHEIQHYIHQHPINNYVNSEKLRQDARLLGISSADDYIAARTRYSRELELDADELGFELYQKSGYTLSACEGVFDMLDFADEPFDQMPWSASVFEWEFLRFPHTFEQWPLDTIAFEEDAEDEMSTHPNIAKRRAVIAQKIAESPTDNGETFVIGAPEFLEARKRCRFELCELYLANHEYEAAIYNSHLLQAEEPDSRYLQKIIAESLYGLASYKNARRFADAHLDPDLMGGEFQQLVYFMDMQRRESLTIVALREAWRAYLIDQEDIELKAIAQALLDQLVRKHRSTAEMLAHEQPASMPPLIDSLMARKLLALQRRGEPAAEKPEKEDDEEEETENGLAFLEWSLTDLFQIEQFADAWAATVDSAKKLADEEYVTESKMRSLTRKEQIKGIHLGIDSIVFVQPIYKQLDMRDRIPVQYIASEDALTNYKDILSEMADRNALHHQFLENRNLQVGDVELFNDVSNMLLWFSEHSNSSDEKLNLVNFRQDEAKALAAKYGTRYFAWNGIVQVTEKLSPQMRLAWLGLGCMMPPLLPISFIKMSHPETKTLFVTLVFDLEQSEAIWEEYRVLKAKAGRAITRSIVFDHLFQISPAK